METFLYIITPVVTIVVFRQLLIFGLKIRVQAPHQQTPDQFRRFGWLAGDRKIPKNGRNANAPIVIAPTLKSNSALSLRQANGPIALAGC